MDVALDANAYLADPRMEGVAFRTLFDYLRKTDSVLIIPKVVFDEVIARYPDRLRQQIKKTISEVATLRNLIVNSKIPRIPEVEIASEVKALKRRLAKPSKHIKTKLLKNFRNVSVEEVATRGIRRIPPANANGEELRDVMTWLMVLDYAKRSRREVALVTADGHFRQEGALHPELAKEVRANKIDLRFAISIDAFIKGHAPKPTDLTEDQAFDLYGRTHVLDRFEIEVRRYLPPYWRSASSIEVAERKIRFVKGALYDVGPDSRYGEIEFAGELRLRVTTTQALTQTVQFGTPPLPYPQPPTFILSPSSYGLQPPAFSPSYGIPTLASQTWNVNQPINMGTLTTASALYGPMPAFYGGGQAFPSAQVSREYGITAKLIISLRVVSGKLTDVETERLESMEMTTLS